MIRDEAAIVRTRINNELVSAGMLTQAAILSALSEEGGTYFRELTRSLIED